MKRFKKGFTIVELVIVIAVIGILTAVLIPTFSNLIAKAKLSNDNILVRSINQQLAAAEQIDGKNQTMYDALKDAKDAGYIIENINAKSDNQLVWDEVKDRFALISNDDEVIYGEVDNINNKTKLWKIYTKLPRNNEQVYSIYAANNFEMIENEPIKVGFDAGDNTNIENILYSTDSAQKVVIRTNGGNLTINAQDGNVKHYGTANVLNIQEVAQTSYHEFGTVTFAKITKGRIVLEKTSNVGGLHITAQNNNFAKVAVAVVGETTLPALSRDDVELENNSSKLVLEVQTLTSSQAVDANPEYIWISRNDVGEESTKVTTDEQGTVNAEIVSEVSQQVVVAVSEPKTEKQAQNAASEVVTPIFDDKYVVRISTVGYETLESALSNTEDQDIVYLLKDVEFDRSLINANSYRLFINKSITFIGNNKTVTAHARGFGLTGKEITFKDVTITNPDSQARCIDTRGNIEKLTLNNVKLLTTYSAKANAVQPLTIGGDNRQLKDANNNIINVKLNIINSTISTSDDGHMGYAITVFNPIDAKIENSTIAGWACLNFKAADGSVGSHGSKIEVVDGKFISTNPNTGNTNNYGAMKFEDYAGSVDVSFKGTEMTITSLQGKYQAVAAYQVYYAGTDEQGNIIYVFCPSKVELGEGVKINFQGNQDATPFAVNNGSNTEFVITGGTYNQDPTEFVDLETCKITHSGENYIVSKK